MSDERSFRLQTADQILRAALEDQRRSAKEPRPTSSAATVGSPPGADQVEDLLAAIVAGVLGRAAVRRDLSFSALGGDSLLATRVLARVWRAFEVKLPLSVLLPGATVSDLTVAVKRAC